MATVTARDWGWIIDSSKYSPWCRSRYRSRYSRHRTRSGRGRGWPRSSTSTTLVCTRLRVEGWDEASKIGFQGEARDIHFKRQKGRGPLCMILTLGAAGCDIVRTLSIRDTLTAPETVNGRGEALLGVLPHCLLLEQPPGPGWKQTSLDFTLLVDKVGTRLKATGLWGLCRPSGNKEKNIGRIQSLLEA